MSKKAAIVQSNYIPWKGYFDLINMADQFILLDDVQYTKHDWRNRNKIKTPNGVRWLTIPVYTRRRYLQRINETAYFGGWEKPRDWWRSDKKISGGAFYDWGAHYLDWTLRLIPEARMTHITGFFHQDVVWKQFSNEDQAQAIVRFDTGCVADVQISSVAFVGRPRWRILGTKGAIEDWRGGSFTVYTQVKGYPAQIEVEYLESQWPEYYKNIAAHLTRGTELAVKPEEAARTIAIMEYAERSSKQGKTFKPPCP